MIITITILHNNNDYDDIADSADSDNKNNDIDSHIKTKTAKSIFILTLGTLVLITNYSNDHHNNNQP